MRTTPAGHRPASVSQPPATQPPAGPSDKPTDQPNGANLSTAVETNSGCLEPRTHRPTARQASLLAQLAKPLQATSPHGGSQLGPVDFTTPQNNTLAEVFTDQGPTATERDLEVDSPNKPCHETHINLNQSASAQQEPPLGTKPSAPLTRVSGLGQLNAELFANDYITQGLQSLKPGSNVLVLSDGKESKSAGTFSLDYSNLNIYSTDYSFPETAQRIELFGFCYNRVKLDNTKPINPNVFGSPETKFGSVVMLKGLCDHNEWKDKHGNDAGAVGCAGVQLSAKGISSLLASMTPLLTENARFALHGDINFMDKVAEHQALGLAVQRDIIKGVERFNAAYGEAMAGVHVGDTGLVITGENIKPLSPEQTERLKSLVHDYFSQDLTVSCEQYPR